jgi:signal transduction histidine kinase
MNAKAYRWSILLNILLLFADMLLLAYALQQHQWYVTTAVTGLLMPLMTYGLIRSTDRYRKDMSDFLLTIRQKDYMHYHKKKFEHQQLSGGLDYAFHVIAGELKDVRIDKEAHYHHLKEVVGHLDTAIISYMGDGSIHLLNQTARDMLHIPGIRHFRELRKYHPGLYEEIAKMAAGQRRMFNLPLKEGVLNLALRSSEFRLQDHRFKLISLQDIRPELEAREVESWQKLIRMLRHEIMNSATPISSLSESVKESLEELLQRDARLSQNLREELEDMHLSLNTIHTRTRGLLRFVQNYRKLTGLPQPHMQTVDLNELTQHVLQLLSSEMEKHSITLQADLPEDTTDVQVDYDQIEQVVINILLNAIDAVRSTPDAGISVGIQTTPGNKICLEVVDNGTGIAPEDMQHIFIPFYSTKKDGSGIGLSLARQIMTMHHGEITVRSVKDKGTTCGLVFNR